MGHVLYQMSIYPIAQIIELTFTFFRKLFDSSLPAPIRGGVSKTTFLTQKTGHRKFTNGNNTIRSNFIDQKTVASRTY
jgi:hypothetical protein